jgi:hypothetical protein
LILINLRGNLRVFNKKILLIIFLVLLFFTGIIALTKEIEETLPVIIPDETEIITESKFDFERYKDNWLKPPRWFRSNAAGMALEEIESRFKALRYPYALAIIYVSDDEIPDYLTSYFNENYVVEVRILYKNNEQIRTQWLFRDENGTTRLNAVLLEPEPEIETESEIPKNQEAAQTAAQTAMQVAAQVNAQEVAQIVAQNAAQTAEQVAALEEALLEEYEEEINNKEIVILKDIKNRKGFIEIFDEKTFLSAEYRYFEDGKAEKTEYTIKDNLLITASYFVSIKNNKNFKPSYIDYYRYNRSYSLRNIERIFQDDITLAPATVSFPRRIMDSLKAGVAINEKINLYPDFFGNIFVGEGYRMDFNIDDKGRILGQNLYDEENKLVWTIQNTWKDNRIVSTTKTEGAIILSAEYAYNKDGEIIGEKNYKNGVLERVVSIDGDKEIEELYMNNTVVLRAVWEDGRKISETRIKN